MKKDEKSNDLITTRNTHSMEKNEKRWKKDMKKKRKKKKWKKLMIQLRQETLILSKIFESNLTCYPITFFSKFKIHIMQCNVFFLVRNRLIAKLLVMNYHWALFPLRFKIVIESLRLTESTVYFTPFTIKAGG